MPEGPWEAAWQGGDPSAPPPSRFSWAGFQLARSQDENVITIATAGHGGVYLPAGNAICQFVNAERARHHELVRVVFSNLELFRRPHPALADQDRAEMVGFGNTAPLHAGAERYVREAGLLR